MAAVARLFRSSTTASMARRYGLAVLVSAFAYLLQRIIWPFIPPSPHLLFYPAVFVAARFGGARPGYVATVLSTLGIAHGFLPPEGFWAADQPGDVLDLAIFFGVGIAISLALGRLRVAIERERADADAARVAKESTDATWSMIAHDLRTPLNVITLSSTELGRRTGPAEVEKMVGMIRRSTDRARHLLADALDAMRSAEGKLRVEPGPCDVRELCAHALDAVASLAASKGVLLESDGGAAATTLCDQPRLEQVLTNLLGNAIQFTPRGGAVSLYVDSAPEQLTFSVTDTGRGIPQEEIATIFSKYWSGKGSPGTGLGLWIACAILAAHGSKLDVSSRVGTGSTFSFVLPVVDVPASSGERAPARAS